MQLQPGQAVLAMVLDTLSGRTLLYRLKEFFHQKDTELLLGTVFCTTDAETAVDKLHAAAIGSCRKLDCTIEKVAKFGRRMHRCITDTGNTITGWKDKPTTKPTSFMMTTKS